MGAVYTVRPLFVDSPRERDEILTRAINRLFKEVRQHLDGLARQVRHDELARYCYYPHLESQSLKLKILLGNRSFSCRLLFVSTPQFGRKLVFTPTFPDLWFDLERGQSLSERATNVLTRYFRELEKQTGHEFDPEPYSLKGEAWLVDLELDIITPLVSEPRKPSLFALLGGQEVLSGAEELQKVGRCLNWQYPDDLDRAILRVEEVSELARLLDGKDKRPVLLMGARQVGKTAVIHECVYQRVKRSEQPYTGQDNVWLISPQRLISGMSYVGQWENRLLAILKEAGTKNHVLYFDNLLGLFTAGLTSDSNLSVAHVLKPYVERREVRVLGEITPEAFRVLQERDRSFADLFQILHIRETDDEETLQIQIGLIRELERLLRCLFEIEALPTVIDLHRRYARDAAFPGKAAKFLRQLAQKYRNAPITRAHVLTEFQAKSGLSLSFLDDETTLSRDDIITALGKDVIGQDKALVAAGDVISIAKARLNDPTRPLASFLFLGPTGVGKTQCAKAVARYLFGSAEKILRFDMNEFVSPHSVARLVGTFDQPEGLLTSAIRRQPFSVILLDEIEKAHPDVFNLLLQLLGEGRLTDALGRTSDFTNAIVILTSNLGVKEASGNLGFKRGHSREGGSYVKAAQKFFKPEFFNRLDRILPFERLSRADIQKVARLMLRDVFKRDGLVRRKCILQIDERAMVSIIEQGYHPLLGARALKRTIEQRLTSPVAARLAAIAPGTPTVISIFPTKEGVGTRVDRLIYAEIQPFRVATFALDDSQEVMACVEDLLDQVEEEIQAARPMGAIGTDTIAPDQYHYFVVKEQLQKLRKMHEYVGDLAAKTRRSGGIFLAPSPRGKRRTLARAIGKDRTLERLHREINEADDLRGYMKRIEGESQPIGRELADYLADLTREAALLNELATVREASQHRAVVQVWAANEVSKPFGNKLTRLYEKLFRDQLGFEATVRADKEAQTGGRHQLLLSGVSAYALALIEQGTHLFLSKEEALVPIRVTVAAGGSLPEDSFTLAKELESDLPPVIRLYDEAGATLDLRSGLMTEGLPLSSALRSFLLSNLPLPEEFLFK